MLVLDDVVTAVARYELARTDLPPAIEPGELAIPLGPRLAVMEHDRDPVADLCDGIHMKIVALLTRRWGRRKRTAHIDRRTVRIEPENSLVHRVEKAKPPVDHSQLVAIVVKSRREDGRRGELAIDNLEANDPPQSLRLARAAIFEDINFVRAAANSEEPSVNHGFCPRAGDSENAAMRCDQPGMVRDDRIGERDFAAPIAVARERSPDRPLRQRGVDVGHWLMDRRGAQGVNRRPWSANREDLVERSTAP